MEAGLPETDSKESEEGRLLHKLDADPSLSRKKLKPNQRDLLDISEKLDQEVFKRVADNFGADIEHRVNEVRREHTMWLRRGIKSLFPGTCDLKRIYSNLRALLVVDKKFGFKQVTPAAANLQLRSYGVMAADEERLSGSECEQVVVAITQPRLGFDDRITMAVYGRDEIKASREQLYQIWDASKKPDAPLVAGEEQCRYCKAAPLGICPAFNKMVQSGLAVIPSPEGLTKTAREAAIEERIKQASDDELGKMYQAVHLAGFVKDPLFDEIRRRIGSGGMPGYRLGKETEVRNIVDAQAAHKAMVESGKIPAKKFFKHVEVSIGGMEEELRTAAAESGGKMTWDKARAEVNTALGEAIERKTRKPSIEICANLNASSFSLRHS